MPASANSPHHLTVSLFSVINQSVSQSAGESKSEEDVPCLMLSREALRRWSPRQIHSIHCNRWWPAIAYRDAFTWSPTLASQTLWRRGPEPPPTSRRLSAPTPTRSAASCASLRHTACSRCKDVRRSATHLHRGCYGPTTRSPCVLSPRCSACRSYGRPSGRWSILYGPDFRRRPRCSLEGFGSTLHNIRRRVVCSTRRWSVRRAEQSPESSPPTTSRASG